MCPLDQALAAARRLEALRRVREDLEAAPSDAAALLATVRELLAAPLDADRAAQLAEIDAEIIQAEAELADLDQTLRRVGGTAAPGIGVIFL